MGLEKHIQAVLRIEDRIQDFFKSLAFSPVVSSFPTFFLSFCVMSDYWARVNSSRATKSFAGYQWMSRVSGKSPLLFLVWFNLSRQSGAASPPPLAGSTFNFQWAFRKLFQGRADGWEWSKFSKRSWKCMWDKFTCFLFSTIWQGGFSIIPCGK